MRILNTVEELHSFRHELAESDSSLGFVPTMGALHEAHLALAETSMQQNKATLVSIFVNPTQFNNPEDLEKYPRRVEDDCKWLAEKGVDAVFIPAVEAIYGTSVRADAIDLNGLDQGMEGTYRPGHFPGVATVIKRFFELMHPTRAYFGEKDYQQLRVIEYMTESLGLGVEIIGCPTERTPQGLAMSSRNYRLSEKGLEQALIINQNLRWAANNHRALSPKELKKQIRANFAQSPLELEYVEIADPKTMKPLHEWGAEEHARIFMAAFCEGVRLIDNYRLF